MSQSKLVTGLVASLAVGLALVARAASADAGPGASHDAGDRPSPYAPAPRYTGVERSGRYLTMRDGVRIAIELYLPPGLEPDARIPTILHQTRYWRAKSLRWPASAVVDELSTQGRIGEFKRRAVEQGYAWVDVDTRGSGASFGNRPWDYSPDEIQDGAQIVDWIIGQPWSNGRVGAAGASYSGSSAEFALLARHPAVRAVAPMLCEFDQYTDILAPGGVPFAGFFEQWGSITGMLDRGEVPRLRWGWQFVRGVRPVDEDRDGALLAAALADHAQNYDFQSLARVVFRDDLPFDPAAPAPPLRREAMQRAFRFFEQRFGPGFLARGIDLASAHAYEAELAGSAAPVYAISGWLDGPYANAAVKRFLAHPRPGNKLLIGAWDHTLQEASPFGPGGPARFDLAGELLKFFDRYLKELDDGIDREAPVHYFTMGDERWQAASTWPPAATLRRFHLAAGGRLALEPPPAGDGADAFHVDPATGAGHETRWDALLGRTFARAYPDRATRDRSLLVYTSDPLPTDAEVTGHPVVTLHVTSSASDGAFFVYLEDVDPEGRVTYVTEGLLRALHRRSMPPRSDEPPVPERSYRRQAAEPLQPGAPAELAFDLLPTSYVFRAGHAIRVAIAGADRDHFAPIPSDAAPDAAPQIEVHRDAARPSRIDLPVVTR